MGDFETIMALLDRARQSMTEAEFARLLAEIERGIRLRRNGVEDRS